MTMMHLVQVCAVERENTVKSKTLPPGAVLWAVMSMLFTPTSAAAQPEPLHGAAETRLVDAVQNQDHEAAHALLNDDQVDVNIPQADGATAIAWAAHWNDLDTASLLIRADADVNATNQLGITALMLAARNGSVAAMATVTPSRAPRRMKASRVLMSLPPG